MIEQKHDHISERASPISPPHSALATTVLTPALSLNKLLNKIDDQELKGDREKNMGSPGKEGEKGPM